MFWEEVHEVHLQNDFSACNIAALRDFCEPSFFVQNLKEFSCSGEVSWTRSGLQGKHCRGVTCLKCWQEVKNWNLRLLKRTCAMCNACAILIHSGHCLFKGSDDLMTLMTLLKFLQKSYSICYRPCTSSAESNPQSFCRTRIATVGHPPSLIRNNKRITSFLCASPSAKKARHRRSAPQWETKTDSSGAQCINAEIPWNPLLHSFFHFHPMRPVLLFPLLLIPEHIQPPKNPPVSP